MRFLSKASNDVNRKLNIRERARILHSGFGETREFDTIVERISDGLEADVEPEYADNPIPGQVYVRDARADPAKIRDAIGWKPRVSFEEGIRRVCEPYLKP